MSTVVIAKQPDLTFLTTSRRIGEENDSPLPMLFKKDGCFDWDANSYITKYAGGSQTYNIKPLAGTVVKKAYSLNLFCTFIQDNHIELYEINDSKLYQYIESLKERGINDDTIISHGRIALGYIEHLTNIYPGWNLSTHEKNTNEKFNVHHSIRTYRSMGREYKYLYHRSFDGLIHIAVEAEYIHDYEYIQWIDAINCTTYHPDLNDFFISRWQALATLLEITGSRISEVHRITRKMIKDASQCILDSEKRPIIRNIPITKGKYKGKSRDIKTTSEDIQIILLYINLIEAEFPNMKHDAIFVDSKTGEPLKSSYLKNYAKKVINGSKYCRKLRHLSNHSFRHRFITLHIAKAIKKIAASGSFSNILNVAATACRKITMHASNATLSHYVHLASEYTDKSEQEEVELSQSSSHIRARINKMITISESLRSKAISDKEALDSIISTLDEFRNLHIS